MSLKHNFSKLLTMKQMELLIKLISLSM